MTLPYIATPQSEVLFRRVARIPRRPPLPYRDSVFVRRLPPNPPQFSGVVEVGDPGAPAERDVQLRLRDGTVLETVRSSAAGAFVMLGWYPVRDDYELHVIGEGYVSRSFPAIAPAAVQWNGNPNVNPSTVPP